MNETSVQKQVQELSQKINQPRQFVKELELLFKFWGNEKAVVESKRTIPNISKIFGVSFPIQDVIALEISKLGASDPEMILNLLKTLWQSSSLEARIITAKILGKVAKKAPEKTLALIKNLLKDIDNWAVCDTLATQGIRGIMPANNDKIFVLALKCIKDRNKWIKRFGVVTTVELAHNKKFEIPEKVFDIVKPLMGAEDADIKKAISWALREISKRKPEMVRDFLKNYQKSKDKNTQWIVKEGSKKL